METVISNENIPDHSDAISPYRENTGRVKTVKIKNLTPMLKVALLGDSTIDNGFWVQNGLRGDDVSSWRFLQDKKLPYAQRTATVTHQIALSLGRQTDLKFNYKISNLSVDGAETWTLNFDFRLNTVLWEGDEDHGSNTVNQIKEYSREQPDVALISVGGNDYRRGLGKLRKLVSFWSLLLRITPEESKDHIKGIFLEVKESLFRDYKALIDEVTKTNPNLKRLVIATQYYPELTNFSGYFIYTGFSHIARTQGLEQSATKAVEETMNELYREVIAYAAAKNKALVVADITSSVSPLGGNHVMQIEPNEKGAQLMGKVFAKAITIDLHKDKTLIPVIKLDDNGDLINTYLKKDKIKDKKLGFSVKPIDKYISEDRYRHLGLLFSPQQSYLSRLENTFYAFNGRHFDVEYTGIPALGLLDVTIIPLMAQQLFRASINENLSSEVRNAARYVSLPIIMLKAIISVVAMLILAIPLYAMHSILECLREKDEEACNSREVGSVF